MTSSRESTALEGKNFDMISRSSPSIENMPYDNSSAYKRKHELNNIFIATKYLFKCLYGSYGQQSIVGSNQIHGQARKACNRINKFAAFAVIFKFNRIALAEKVKIAKSKGSIGRWDTRCVRSTKDRSNSQYYLS